MRTALPTAVLLLLAAGCARTTTASFIEERRATHRVTEGFVKRLKDLESPEVRKLADGVAYTATRPGGWVVLEFGRGRLQRFDLEPGDVFVQGRPLCYLLQRIPGR